jgi:hypothetical protein
MGLSTPDNKKQLIKDRNKKAFELKRLQSKQRSSNKYRIKKKKNCKIYFEKNVFHHFFCFILD